MALFASACSFDSISSLTYKFFFDNSFSLNSLLNINSTMTRMPSAGSCPTRRSTTPTYVASWNFSLGSQSSSTVAVGLLPSVGGSFWILGLMIFNGTWVSWHLATLTTTPIHQSTIGLPTAGLLPWKRASGPSPTTCPTVQSHGVITKETLLALLP